MKWSPILHIISFVATIMGVLILIGYWIAATKQGINPFSAQHLYDDAIAILLVSISFGIGTLIHLLEERK